MPVYILFDGHKSVGYYTFLSLKTYTGVKQTKYSYKDTPFWSIKAYGYTVVYILEYLFKDI